MLVRNIVLGCDCVRSVRLFGLILYSCITPCVDIVISITSVSHLIQLRCHLVNYRRFGRDIFSSYHLYYSSCLYSLCYRSQHVLKFRNTGFAIFFIASATFHYCSVVIICASLVCFDSVVHYVGSLPLLS